MKPVRLYQQQGAVLITSLVLLFVLTLLGISHINLTLLHERMAGNAQTAQQILQAAEAGLRDGEQDIVQNIQPSTVFHENCAQGLCQAARTGEHVWLSGLVDWVNDVNTIAYGANTGVPALSGVVKQPRYIIERLQVVDPGGSLKRGFTAGQQDEWYRVTAVGYGSDGAVGAMVQSVYRQ